MTGFNFGGLQDDKTRLESSKTVIVPVPYDGTTSFRSGTREGPLAIISASRFLELYDEETDQDISETGIATLGEMEPLASSPEAMIEAVREACLPLLQQGKTVVVLGGEHSVSLGAIKAVADYKPSFSILQFDAHADLRNSYQNTPFSHACVMRRAMEYNPIEQVGIRSLSREEAVFIKGSGLKPFYAPAVLTDREAVLQELLTRLLPEVYITIDLDVLDPSIMPAVGTPEPGGLGWYDLLFLLRHITRKKHVLAFDVVELSPQPGNVAPDFLAAKLIYKLLNYIGH
ncbi:MAG: agmatinase [Thermodesulfobacteriota bacterium]|nr:agmatinase [Thermodesulfobacteriota bacterium]